jgi:hypothetical protein
VTGDEKRLQLVGQLSVGEPDPAVVDAADEVGEEVASL